tara:strand:- start:49 stop:300 length:252 start_codon:yes stop_codon:yes gene_type:complete
MKDKILPNDINSRSLDELTYLVNKIIEKLESEKNLEKLIEDYQRLIKLNNIIEKKFQKTSKQISIETKEKIKKIINKNAKKIK